MLTSGLGSLLGNLMAGELAGTRLHNDVLVFLIPCVIDGAMLIYFLTGFDRMSGPWIGPAHPLLSFPRGLTRCEERSVALETL